MPDTPISGATSSTYTLVTGDIAANIFCRVTAHNSVGDASADSNTVGPVTAAPSGGTFAFIGSAVGSPALEREQITPLSGETSTTAAMDTTGAGLLLISLTQEWSTAAAISDSKGNTWTKLTEWYGGSGSGGKCILYYCKPTSVGSGHTVTATGGAGSYPTTTFMAFSGGAASPFDQEVGGGEGAGPEAAGSVAALTPSVPNALVIAVVGIAPATGTLSSITPAAPAAGGFTLLPPPSGWPQAVGYLIQTTAAAADPVWTFSTAVNWSGSLATFKP